jgi:hypothetical protein
VLKSAAALGAVCACALWLGAAVGQADTSVIPDTQNLPWTDPTHQSPLEVFAGQIASSIVGRPVRVYCNGQNDWDTLAQSVGFDGSTVWGYVAQPRYWYPALGVYAEDSTHTQLATKACDRLWQFAKASVKPTKCAATRDTAETKIVTVRYRAPVAVKVKKHIIANGRRVTRVVTVRRMVWKTRKEKRTQTRTEQVGMLPCYSTPESDVTLATPSDGERGYVENVFAIATLAHESIHLFDFTSGKPVVASRPAAESRAECIGMQDIARVAIALGAAPDDASNMQRWYWENFYPTRRTQLPDYWSADCRPDGPLDQTPGDGIWP